MATQQKVCSWDYDPHPIYNLWTTGNVSEVLPGVIRPLSADLIGRYMHLYAKAILENIGVQDIVQLAEPPTANVFAFFGGRWAVNVAWLNAYFASFSPDQQAEILEQFMSGDNLRSQKAADRERALQAQAAQQQLWAGSIAQAKREAEVAANWQREMQRRDLASLSHTELIGLIDQTIELCGDLFVTHSYTTTAGGAFNAQLKAFLDEKLPGHDPEWETRLTSALGDVVSAEPVQAIWRLAQRARELPSVARALTSDEIATLRRYLEAPPDDDWRTFAAEYTAFIDRYGFRGQNEVDPAVPDWGEDPAFVLSALRVDVLAPPERDPARAAREAEAARESLEREIEGRLAPEDRARFRELLSPTQEYVRAREQSKANWARACRALRPPLIEIGRRFTSRGLIGSPDDLFFLRWAEVQEGVANILTPERARAAVAERRAEYERLQGFKTPEMFSLPVELIPLSGQAEATTELKGLGVSAGVATGRARIVRSAEANTEVTLEPGEILVAPFTDAPWTPLFWPAAAVVTETGGLLSHAATVAREYGIPAVVNVPGATRLIKDGDIVTVDGAAGVVRLHRQPA
jgi:phosphohistidine swiveling domain-containing protein